MNKQKNSNIGAEDTMIKKMVNFKTKAIDDEQYIIYGVFSTDNEDWNGEKVEQGGWDLSVFNTNPVILFSHDHYQPAVGQGVDIKVQDEGMFLNGVPNGNMVLAGGVKFAAAEYDFAMTLYRLYAGKYMRAFSAGFYNNEAEYDGVNDVYVLKTNVLLEISCCNIPANMQALARSKGIDTAPITRIIEERNEKEREEQEKQLRMMIEKTINSLNEQNIRTDIAKTISKVETPVGQGRRGYYSTKLINKSIRRLLKQKSLIEK